MVKNKIGKKVIGTALSMAIAITAIPAMTTLACEHNLEDRTIAEVTLRRAPEITAYELGDRLINVINYYYENEAYIPADVQAQCQMVFFEVSLIVRDPFATPGQLASGAESVQFVNDAVSYYSDEAVREALGRETALQRLYNIMSDMVDLEAVFGFELEDAVNIDGYNTWLAFGAEVYMNNASYSTDDINNLADILTGIYTSAIDAIDALNTQPEDVAPDYGMNLDEDIIVDENETTETIDETSIESSTEVSEASAVVNSAPATQVAGASRTIINTREAMAEQIVERLYNNALNRKSDAAGRRYWINTILAGNGNVDMVISGFLNSTEFNARNLSDDEFVTTLYRVILNRVPSASEASTWTNALANGTSRRDIVNAFINSSEFDTTCEAHAL